MPHFLGRVSSCSCFPISNKQLVKDVEDPEAEEEEEGHKHRNGLKELMPGIKYVPLPHKHNFKFLLTCFM